MGVDLAYNICCIDARMFDLLSLVISMKTDGIMELNNLIYSLTWNVTEFGRSWMNKSELGLCN